MTLSFTNTESEAVTYGVKMLGHAPSGSGKTLLAATMPNPVIISAESGLLSLSRRNIERVFGPGRDDIAYNIPVIKLESALDLEDAYNWATQSEEASDFQSIILDSVTEIMEQILRVAKASAKDPRQAYGVLNDQGEDVVKKFRDIPGKHIYMAAKQGSVTDETSGVTGYGPIMPGKKLGPAMPYLYDLVFALRIGEDDNGKYRYIQTDRDLQYEAKDRSGMLDFQEEAHLGKIIEKIVSGDYAA